MKTILVADDNRRLRELCQCELEDSGYRVIVARDGREAVELTTEHAPDLVVLDIFMPRLDGLEAIERLKRLRPTMPVLFLTAADAECMSDPRARLAVAYVQKGRDLEELKCAVRAALAPDGGHEPVSAGAPCQLTS